jgi:hypothetical protein
MPARHSTLHRRSGVGVMSDVSKEVWCHKNEVMSLAIESHYISSQARLRRRPRLNYAYHNYGGSSHRGTLAVAVVL